MLGKYTKPHRRISITNQNFPIMFTPSETFYIINPGSNYFYSKSIIHQLSTHAFWFQSQSDLILCNWALIFHRKGITERHAPFKRKEKQPPRSTGNPTPLFYSAVRPNFDNQQQQKQQQEENFSNWSFIYRITPSNHLRLLLVRARLGWGIGRESRWCTRSVNLIWLGTSSPLWIPRPLTHNLNKKKKCTAGIADFGGTDARANRGNRKRRNPIAAASPSTDCVYRDK